MMSMKPTKTGQIENSDIYAVNNGINSVFFVKANDGYIMVDGGGNMGKIEKAMSIENIDPSKVTAILLTHSDSDHMASLPLFHNAPLYMSEDEMQMVDGTTKRNLTSYNSFPKEFKKDKLVLVKDSEELNLGGKKVECIKFPGHTPGSMAYIVDGKYFFSGDAFAVKNNTIKIHPFTMNDSKAKESIDALKEVIQKTDVVITAHYGYYRSDDLLFD